MKYFNILGVHEKPTYRGLSKKEKGGVFKWGVETPTHTMTIDLQMIQILCSQINLYKILPNNGTKTY